MENRFSRFFRTIETARKLRRVTLSGDKYTTI